MLNSWKADLVFLFFVIPHSNTISPSPADKALSSTVEIMRDNPAWILYSLAFFASWHSLPFWSLSRWRGQGERDLSVVLNYFQESSCPRAAAAINIRADMWAIDNHVAATLPDRDLIKPETCPVGIAETRNVRICFPSWTNVLAVLWNLCLSDFRLKMDFIGNLKPELITI